MGVALARSPRGAGLLPCEPRLLQAAGCRIHRWMMMRALWLALLSCIAGICTFTGGSSSAEAGCVEQGTGGTGGWSCVLAQGVTELACAGEKVPGRVVRRVDRALGLLDRAQTDGRPRKIRRLAKKAARHLKRAGRIVQRAASLSRNSISVACANELAFAIEGARQTALAIAAAARPAERHNLAVVMTTDFANTGSYATVTLDDTRAVRADLARTYQDSIGRVFEERLYVVNRLGQDNLQIIKPASGKSVAACSIKNGSNPQDVAFVSRDKAYVSRMRDGIVAIVDPTVPSTCRGFRLGRIDLNEFADADGSPELGRMLVVGSRLYVAVLRLDRNRGFLPAGGGMVAVVDTKTDTLIDVDPATPEVDAIRLARNNPFGMIHDPASGKIWVLEAGKFYVPDDGGIEAIDPITNRAEGLLATEADLGGTVTAAAPYAATRAFAIVADEIFRNRLVAFSPATGQVLETLRTGSATSYFPDVAVNDRGEVWLADRTLAEPGIRIFDAQSGQAISGVIDVGLPPFAVLFMK